MFCSVFNREQTYIRRLYPEQFLHSFFKIFDGTGTTCYFHAYTNTGCILREVRDGVWFGPQTLLADCGACVSLSKGR